MLQDNEATWTLDLSAVGVVMATLAGWLPVIASILSIVWFGIRIWESKTVQDWVMKKARAEARKEVVAEVVAAITPSDPSPIKEDIQKAIDITTK